MAFGQNTLNDKAFLTCHVSKYNYNNEVHTVTLTLARSQGNLKLVQGILV